jgi:hypothetical protein
MQTRIKIEGKSIKRTHKSVVTIFYTSMISAQFTFMMGALWKY